MPTYAYRCKSCSHEFEELQRNTDAPLKRCPSCHKETLVRNIGGGAGLMFKGSGFYQTDYKRSGKGGTDRSEPKKEKKAEPKPESKPDSKSDSNAKKPG